MVLHVLHFSARPARKTLESVRPAYASRCNKALPSDSATTLPSLIFVKKPQNAGS